jgi:hypothetical protein
MELVVLVAVLAGLYFFGEWAVRNHDEGKRSRQAIRTENSRVRNNQRLKKTDCYVYLIKRERNKGKPFESTYLKIGIGVEDRVRLQLKEEGNSLICLYVFRVRDDAFNIEQKVLKSWNNKVLGEITTHNRYLGTEYIRYSEKDLNKALKILEESGGENVLSDDTSGQWSASEPKPTEQALPPILNRTIVYLLINKREKLIKVGMGTFDRPDSFRGQDWEIARFCHFADRESARNAESKVLSYWRNDLGMQIPERAKSLLKSGHTETVESSVGIVKAWEIIVNSHNFIPLVSQSEQKALDDYDHLLERGKLIWDDDLFWMKIRQTWYGSIESKIYQLSNSVSTQLHIRGDSKLAKTQLRAFAKEFQEFMNKNHAILDRARSMKNWETADQKSDYRPARVASIKPKTEFQKVDSQDEVSRFWKKVQKSDDCWQWTGAIIPSGYGLATFENRNQPAHRVSWKLEFGECAPEAMLDNKCGNRSCVRTEHWELSVKRRSKPGEIRISPFVCTTPNCGKPSVTMTVAGLCDSCRQRAKRERRKLREAQGNSDQERLPDLSDE